MKEWGAANEPQSHRNTDSKTDWLARHTPNNDLQATNQIAPLQNLPRHKTRLQMTSSNTNAPPDSIKKTHLSPLRVADLLQNHRPTQNAPHTFYNCCQIDHQNCPTMVRYSGNNGGTTTGNKNNDQQEEREHEPAIPPIKTMPCTTVT